MTQILELWDRKCELTMINRLRALMKKVDNIYEQMNKQRDRTPKNQIKTLQIKNTVNRKEECLQWAHQ